MGHMAHGPLKSDRPSSTSLAPQNAPAAEAGQDSSLECHIRRTKSDPPIIENPSSGTSLSKETNSGGSDSRREDGRT
jgi:hypothetical protein